MKTTITASEIAHLTTSGKLEAIGYSKETISSFLEGVSSEKHEERLKEELNHCLHESCEWS
ncbi:hypothetical protein [Enterococcus rivorum]|uniref:Uncharacterized protein n=1 Tax=Enterococcus rivorum TaxID=762845 RepID=A0A1E5L0I1_9ENTE|nr:hypothetical protein [Enterococcus rivorum]MBP2098855.1 Holliday junction resolvasome RuvABC DNA-binding subunit [Enterococcus rivorum]OEH83584.1 hypothetical protein BCR26_08890 [Enterococcus rivorum]